MDVFAAKVTEEIHGAPLRSDAVVAHRQTGSHVYVFTVTAQDAGHAAI